uniref:Diverged serine protease n=1 Tax=Helicoverpa armigera TaxID=29058 RepID=O18449_HELAM|nr:diverged serine protease [Helicoverpa armigera]
MKGFAFVLLCALVAVQGRHRGELSRQAAALGEQPWVVHLRVAVETSGNLNSCVGSLIDNQWVLTAASCLSGSRFIWVRYGAVDVIRPSLVTENSNIRIHPQYSWATGAFNVGLISINRFIQSTDNISPVPLVGDVYDSAIFCGYGAREDGQPGEQLSCYPGVVEERDTGRLVFNGEGAEATKYDIGAPIVSNGVQVAIVTGVAGDYSAELWAVASIKDWLENMTGINFRPDDSESGSDEEEEAAAVIAPEAVRFVN